jgi:hypothetical protein
VSTITGIAFKKASLQMLSMQKFIHGLSLACVSLLGSATLAGPYFNVENNGSWSKDDFTGSATDFHIGYETEIGAFNAFIQGGPMLNSPDNDDAETNLSGKLGGSIAASENLDIYGEFSLVSADDNSYGTKLGAKLNF